MQRRSSVEDAGNDKGRVPGRRKTGMETAERFRRPANNGGFRPEEMRFPVKNRESFPARMPRRVGNAVSGLLRKQHLSKNAVSGPLRNPHPAKNAVSEMLRHSGWKMKTVAGTVRCGVWNPNRKSAGPGGPALPAKARRRGTSWRAWRLGVRLPVSDPATNAHGCGQDAAESLLQAGRGDG